MSMWRRAIFYIIISLVECFVRIFFLYISLVCFRLNCNNNVFDMKKVRFYFIVCDIRACDSIFWEFDNRCVCHVQNSNKIGSFIYIYVQWLACRYHEILVMHWQFQSRKLECIGNSLFFSVFIKTALLIAER